MQARAHYDLFVPLFTYPQADFLEHVRRLQVFSNTRYPAAAAEVERFAAGLPGDGAALSDAELCELQELFTRSFEVQSVATLDLGYVAFGDDYKRAELLVNLNQELRAVGVDPGVELSDHLSNVLRLMARWEDEEAAAELVSLILHPGIERMREEFGAERMEARNALYRKHYKTLIDSSPRRATIYRHALGALLEVVRADFDPTPTDRPEKTSDFLISLTRELEMEARGEGQRPSGRMP